MNRLTTTQKDFKNRLLSPVLKGRKTLKSSASPAPSTKSLRSISIPRTLSVPFSLNKFKVLSGAIPQPKKFTDYDSWKLSRSLSTHTKVFIIKGVYPDLKKALTDREWVENPDTASPYFDLLWAPTAKFPANLQDWQRINHFPNNVEICAKWNLCLNLHNLKRLYSIDHNTFFPKCFRLTGKEITDFEDCFKLNKALSILKSCSTEGLGAYEKLMTSVSICRKWVSHLEKPGREKQIQFVSNSEWKVLTNTLTFDVQIEFKKAFAGKQVISAHEIKFKAAEIIERLEKLDPQFCISGKSNLWIVKPGRKSRGRQIAIFDSLEQIKKYTQNPQQWVVQKYIENPLLINEKKFDIRQWVLVSSSEPLTIWLYKSCYLRFAVEKYENSSLGNLFMHLTNNSISKNSKLFKDSEIEGCMWHLDDFSAYLKTQYGTDVWSERIFPDIGKIVKQSLVAVGPLGRKKSFEIFGYDFMIDTKLNTWLIEVNSSPAMDYSTPTTTILVQQVLRDTIKVILGPEADSGGFELLYKSNKFSNNIL